MSLVFESDQGKACANLRKHGITFDEASSAFDDPFARIFVDEDHSGEELREILVGHSTANRLLLVCFREMTKDHIRIVSARQATKKEQHDYEENVIS
ncbi:MAG: BrnT family toxin [Acidobacteriia bacterium]|nr:BrnT family toxin [Terriglobia bacterium]